MKKPEEKKRKDGLMEKTVTLSGKRVHVYGHSTKELERKIEMLRFADYEGKIGISKNTLFKDYAEHYKTVRFPNLSDNTQESYARAIALMNTHIGDKGMGYIKRSEIEAALSHHADTPTTRNKMLSITRLIYNMAIDDGLCQYNPAFNIEPLKTRHKDRRFLSQRERDAVLNAKLPQMERLMIDILYHTGIRKGELLALTRKSIKNGSIQITEQSQSRNGKTTITKLKTQNAYRKIPIPEFLEQEIRDYLKTCDYVYMFQPIRSRNAFYNHWNKILDAICAELFPKYKRVTKWRGLTKDYFPLDLNPHDLRHNFCSLLYEKGVDIKVTQYLMGHSSINTTLAIYTHLAAGRMEDALSSVREIFKERGAI